MKSFFPLASLKILSFSLTFDNVVMSLSRTLLISVYLGSLNLNVLFFP